MDNLYFMLNKPRGYITARKDKIHHTIMELMPEELRQELFPVGRLDKDTEGLLLLTNDGQLDQRLMHPKHHVSKTYRFCAIGEVDMCKQARLEEGLMLAGETKITKPAKVTIIETGVYRDYLEPYQLKRVRENEFNWQRPMWVGELTISEGRKHQVKRMLAAIECRVVYLKRVAIGRLPLDPGLMIGQWKELTKEELELLL